MTAVLAVLLFGSLARGERFEGSDVDLLFVQERGEMRHSTVDEISIYYYPWEELRDRASSGDLFACHLVFEAKAIVDPGWRLAELRAAFSFKESYGEEIGHAADLGWFLVRYAEVTDPALVRKRMIWCVRTILIARSAEARSPVFSPKVLADGTRSEAGRELLLERHDRGADALMRDRLRLFLEREAPCDIFHREATFDAFVARFEQTGNRTARHTVSKMVAHRSDYP